MTHDQVRELVRRVNPIPDPNKLETVDAPVLTTERRMDMQTDDRVMVEGGGKSRSRGPLVAIAAAVAVLIAGSLFVLANDDPPVATPAPNATQLTREMAGQSIVPGAYFVDIDGDPATTPRGTFVIEGNNWEAGKIGARYTGTDGVQLMVAEVDYVGAPACGDSMALLPAGSSAEDLANQLASAGFTVQEAVTPVSAFGQNGYHLVVEVPPECSGGANMAWRGPTFGGRLYNESPGQMVEYWLLDVDGTPVMVEASWMASFSDEDVAPLRAAIDTLVMTP
jgi:hypothetical protein